MTGAENESGDDEEKGARPIHFSESRRFQLYFYRPEATINHDYTFQRVKCCKVDPARAPCRLALSFLQSFADSFE